MRIQRKLPSAASGTDLCVFLLSSTLSQNPLLSLVLSTKPAASNQYELAVARRLRITSRCSPAHTSMPAYSPIKDRIIGKAEW
jgi:hypothetical protein